MAWLNEKQIKFETINIVEHRPSRENLTKAIKTYSNRSLLFNTSGKSYRELGAKVVKSMSDNEALDALTNDGKLIKRPFVVIDDNDFLIGFKEDSWLKFFREKNLFL